jgi:hypothetical protein
MIDGAYVGGNFDGRYVYFVPFSADTFLRFDTTLLFSAVASWSTISMSTACGSMTDSAYCGCCFDGRYIYFCPYNAVTMLRFDTTQSFTTAAAWEVINMSTAQGASAVNASYYGNTFDGRYVYFCATNSDTFLRFDTTLLFTNSSAWSMISMSTAQGAAALDTAYQGNTFDGRYVYFVPVNSDTFLRFDTTLLFTNSSAWEVINMSTAQGAAALDTAYINGCFDGQYIYFAPVNSGTFLRFDTTLLFTNSSAWSMISMSTAQGTNIVSSAYAGVFFDGRYIYYTPYNSSTFIRFDTTQSFVNSSAWTTINTSTVQGGASLNTAYEGNNIFDGKFIYFTPKNSDTFIKMLAMNSNIGRR